MDASRIPRWSAQTRRAAETIRAFLRRVAQPRTAVAVAELARAIAADVLLLGGHIRRTTPQAIDRARRFPHVSNESLNLIVILRSRGINRFARIKIPEVLPQWVRVGEATPSPSPQTPWRFVSLLSLIRNNLDDLFPDMQLVDVMRFRVTRNADLERDEEDAEDLLELMEEELRQRRFAPRLGGRLAVAAIPPR